MIFDIDNYSVIPLFPSTVGITRISEDISKLHEIENFKFERANSRGSQSTSDFNILDKFPEQKDLIKKYFTRFKNNVLQLESTDFDISTSWATRCGKDEFSEYHNHKNCYYSAVLYLNDVDKEYGGSLTFNDIGLRPGQFLLNKASNINPLNTDSFNVQPTKNLIIFFPSYLMHRIETYTGKDYRYSIAINFIPIGKFGNSDSTVNIKLQ